MSILSEISDEMISSAVEKAAKSFGQEGYINRPDCPDSSLFTYISRGTDLLTPEEMASLTDVGEE